LTDTSRLARRLATPSAAERDGFARAYAARAFELGLRYLAPEGPRPIPVALPPVVEPRARTAARADLAHAVTGAVAGAARAVLDGALGHGVRDALLAELSPFEREIVLATYRDLARLATVRVDLFVDPAGVDRVLELNATIPAMQGYSDIAARAFLETALARLGGFPEARARERAAALLARNGSNADDLLDSLLACARAAGAGDRPRIALVHRPDDSQLGELEYLAARFRERGHEARTVRSDGLAFDGDGRPVAEDFAPDLLYRHVFARRVDPESPMGTVLRHPDRYRLVNPVDPHLEQKGILALVSAAVADPDLGRRLGLDPRLLARLGPHLPWTRRLVPGPATDPAGAPVADLPAWARVHPADVVVKRSWDYGGKGVFLGAEHGDQSSRLRTRERFGAELSWPELVDACADEGGWVIQERVALASRPALVATADGAVEREVFVDVSAYTNHGVDARPTGGVCRASGSPIVNIQSGGGVVPLIAAEVAAELLDRDLAGR
jgi:hypothetical protein